jgi:hypothetical protein
MTTIKCGKHQTNFSTEFHSTCPRCNPNAPHPDAEDAVFSAIAALSGLYPKRWADAYSLHDQTKVDAIARKCDELRELVADLCTQIDWPADRKIHTVSSHNQERLGASA